MGSEDYSRAYRLGKKDYQARMLRGVRPTLQVLDDFMPEKGAYSEMPLGLVQILCRSCARLRSLLQNGRV